MKILAVIPARGGSKGIPKKNITLLCDKPLIIYILEAARASKYINNIIVSTDDLEIGDIVHKNGMEVVWRPMEISGDSAKSEDALLHVLETYDSDLLVFLQCTAPLTTTEDIDNTIESLINSDADTALSVKPFHYFLWNKNGEGINHNKSQRLLRQEKEEQYLETGAIYVMKTKDFRVHKHRFFGKTSIYIVPSEHVLEIDEPFDLEMAEYILSKRKT